MGTSMKATIIKAVAGFPGAPGGGKKPRDGGIILPGQTTRQSQSARLFVPGQDAVAKAQPPPDQTRKNFRPPPGFMDKQSVLEESVPEVSVDEMVRKLKSQSEVWHVLASFLPQLAAQGLDAAVLEELTGFTKVDQNVLAVAANVRRSLAKGVAPHLLAFYDSQGTQALLYQLRFLSGNPRLRAAQYIAENNLQQEAAWELAKAMKEHSRRNGIKDGFSNDPEDCLAYEFYRHAIESRQNETMLDFIEKGLDIALTPTAVSALEKLRQDTLDASQETSHSNVLQYAKLMKEDVGSRPVAVAGFFSQLTDDMVANCPVAKRSGQFGTFKIDASQTHSWVVLPGWEIILGAQDLIAIEFLDCHSSIPAAASQALASTLEKRKKLKGGAMALVERKFGSISMESLYLAKLENGEFDIIPGCEGINALGEVILLLRPPDQELVYSSLSGLEI